MNHNLIATLWPQARTQAVTKAILIALGVALLALSSKVQVPFWPVPMTLQTLVVLLIGASYGMRLGTATVLAYLAIGAIGAPVFAKGGGLFYMAGPTGGYLAGYLLAAVVMGWLADKGYGRTIASAIGLFLIGEVIIFALGIGWMGTLLAVGSERMSWLKDSLLQAGLTLFIPAEILKMAMAAAILNLGWRQATGK